MKTISIRDIRAPQLRDLAATGTLAAITDNRVLAGVFCPITQQWLTQMLVMNRSRIEQSLGQGEKNLANLTALPGLDSLHDASPASDADRAHRNPLEALQEVVCAFMPGHDKDGGETGPGGPGHRTVRIGELSAPVIREAARNRQMLAVTDRRELVGVIVPVNDQFVAHVVEHNLSRIHRSIVQGERELQSGTSLPTLDEL